MDSVFLCDAKYKDNKQLKDMMLLDIANGWKTAIMIVAMIAVFYFFLIKPQSDRTKKEAAYRDSLKAGDELMTAGGIHVKFVAPMPSWRPPLG